MDFLFTKDKATVQDFDIKDEMLDAKCATDLMTPDWPSTSDSFLDSFLNLDNDLLQIFDTPKSLESLDDISANIKREAQEYEKSCMESNYFDVQDMIQSPIDMAPISSNSSDSGLSSDNLDIEMSPDYEPLSPTMSSPGPSISERGDKNSPVHYNSPMNSPPSVQATAAAAAAAAAPVPFAAKRKIEMRPKVIVQKVPQYVTVSTANLTPTTSTVTLEQGKGLKIVKLSPHVFTQSNNKKVTIQLKNSQNGAKIQANPGTFFIKQGNITEVKKLIRVQNASNPRSVLIPATVQESKDLKGFKIINLSAIQKPQVSSAISFLQHVKETNSNNAANNERIIEECISDHTSDVDSFILEDNQDDEFDCTETEATCNESESSSYPKLMLTTEEKRLLAKEGISLPSHYPLTKHEERELKRIRRKIRNKISAQDSRKRKKEYVDGLEERVRQCTEDNQTLLKRIKILQSQNQNLVSQMKKLQALLSKGTNKTAQPTTCLMVLLLSLALIAAPNLKLGQNGKESDLADAVQETILQNRRNLLFNLKGQNAEMDEEANISDIPLNEISAEREYFNEMIDDCKSSLSPTVAGDSSGSSSSDEPTCKKAKNEFQFDDQNWYNANEIQRKSQMLLSNVAKSFQETMKTVQTSGFNINNNLLESLETLLDKDVLDLISPKSNSLYDLNLDKVTNFLNENSLFDVNPQQLFVAEGNAADKQNDTDLSDMKKY